MPKGRAQPKQFDLRKAVNARSISKTCSIDYRQESPAGDFPDEAKGPDSAGLWAVAPARRPTAAAPVPVGGDG